MGAWESLFWFCVVVLPVLAAPWAVCVSAQSSLVSQMENSGRIKHSITPVTLAQTFFEEPFSASQTTGTDPLLVAGQS